MIETFTDSGSDSSMTRLEAARIFNTALGFLRLERAVPGPPRRYGAALPSRLAAGWPVIEFDPSECGEVPKWL